MKRGIPLRLMLRRWHGRIGTFAALFLLFLALSGVVLNHGTALGLNRHRLHAAWLERWYGIAAEKPVQGYALGDDLLVGANRRWLLKDKVIAEDVGEPLGVVESGGALYVAAGDGLSVYLPDGRLVERISGASLPAGRIIAIGKAGSQVALQGSSGIFSSADALVWKRIAGAGVVWSRPTMIAETARERIAVLLAPGLSAETVLLDLHSGRILGRWGPAFVDGVALTLVALAVSGVVVFARSHHRARMSHAAELHIKSRTASRAARRTARRRMRRAARHNGNGD